MVHYPPKSERLTCPPTLKGVKFLSVHATLLEEMNWFVQVLGYPSTLTTSTRARLDIFLFSLLFEKLPPSRQFMKDLEYLIVATR